MSSDPGQHLKLALIGWGAIGQAVARLLADDPVDIVAVAVRDATVERPGLPSTATLISEPHELAATGADLVVEAAGRASVAPWATAALGSGMDVVVSSISAFTEAGVLDELADHARASGAKLIITPGALGGVGALSAAQLMGLHHVEHRMVKPPKAWAGTPAESLCDLASLTEATVFFSGNASQAAADFPKNANVAMTIALAGRGPLDTQITLVADPTADGNRHEIAARGDFGEFTIVMRNNALPENPKSSAMTALSLARMVQNRISPIVI